MPLKQRKNNGKHLFHHRRRKPKKYIYKIRSTKNQHVDPHGNNVISEPVNKTAVNIDTVNPMYLPSKSMEKKDTIQIQNIDSIENKENKVDRKRDNVDDTSDLTSPQKRQRIEETVVIIPTEESNRTYETKKFFMKKIGINDLGKRKRNYEFDPYL